MRSLSLATVFAAISGFAVVILATKVLPHQLTSEFNGYWAVFFLLTGVIDGLMQETTRTVSAARDLASSPRQQRAARPWRTATVIGVALAAIVALTAPLWIGTQLTNFRVSGVALLVVGVVSYAYQAVLSGILSGTKLWRQYAWLVALDSGVRLALVGIAWVAGWGIFAFLVVTVLGAASWAVVLGCSPNARSAVRAAVDCSRDVFLRRALTAMAATGSSALLITGFPAFMKARSNPSHAGVLLAAMILAVTLTRAPILVPLQRFQSALIVYFVDHRRRILAAAAKPVAAVLGVGLLGAAAAWAIGPFLIVMLSRPEYHVPGAILAVLTFASACTGALMITGTATLAFERHGLYVAGWLAASAVAFAVLAFPVSLEAGVCGALIAGPATGVVVHALGLRRAAAAGAGALS